jgi:hypothetical protein
MDTRNIGTGGLLVVLTGLHAVEVPEGLRATSPAVAVIAQPPELPTAGALVEAPAANLPHRGATNLLNEFLNTEDRSGNSPSPTPDPDSSTGSNTAEMDERL